MAASTRWPALSLSLLLHIGVIALILWIDIAFPPTAPTQYEVETIPDRTPDDSKIIWYDFRKSLPEVTPDHPFGPFKTPHGEIDPSQTLVTLAPDALSTRQVIRQPDHPEPLPADVPAPNLVAIAVKLPPKVFVPPAPNQPHTPAQVVIEAPPAPDTPKSQTSNALGALASLQKLPPKPFVAPPKNSAGAKVVPQVDVPVPSSPDTQANALPGLQAVIVGLNPGSVLPPAGSRSAQIARAPEAGTPSSGALAPGTPVVAGLLSHSKPGETPLKPEAVPAKPVTPRQAPREIVLPGVNRTLSAPLRPSSRIIPASVEAKFSYRNVYTLVIPGPALPGYSGDWVMWFADHDPPEISSGPRVLAPIPGTYAAVSADTQAQGTHVSATFQFGALIDKAGHVASPVILRGPADQELRRRALEELSAWEFRPALRNGDPIEVDIVVEIPFSFPSASVGPLTHLQ